MEQQAAKPKHTFVRAEKGPQGKVRVAVPDIDYKNKGFGTLQVWPRFWQLYIKSAQTVMNTLESGEFPAMTPELANAFAQTKGLFSRIALGDTDDWYTVSRLLGHPSAELSMAMSKRLAIARAAIDNNEPEIYAEAVKRFEDDFGLDMLANYLDMAVNAAHPVEETGWAYILWSSSERDALHIGAAGGQIEDVVKRLNRENRDGHAYGVLAAWLVHEPVEAYNMIHDRLADFMLGDGFFRMDLGHAKAIVQRGLETSQNLSHSPWHSDQAMPRRVQLAAASKPLVMVP